jgi:glutamine amidotransferase
VCEPHSTPKKEELHTAACKNPHGFGYAIIAGDKIISNRGMSAKKIIKEFLEVRAQYPEGYAMWHARYATHGVKNEKNCHPFKVGGSDLTYLAHNGMLDITPPKEDKRSDTRIFAQHWLPSIGGVSALDNPYMLELISGWADYNKICVLTVDPAAEYHMYLINEHLGTWVNGIWWSNDGYKPAVHKTTTTATTSYNHWKEPDYEYHNTYPKDEWLEYTEECIWCDEPTDISVEPFFCMNCNKCFECGTETMSCLCYNPDKEYFESINRHVI